jgi:hypothetical protein
MFKTAQNLDVPKRAGGESEIDMVIRHVREGQRHVNHQRQIITRLEAHGHPAKQARELLVTFEHTQALHRQHLERLVKVRH